MDRNLNDGNPFIKSREKEKRRERETKERRKGDESRNSERRGEGNGRWWGKAEDLKKQKLKATTTTKRCMVRCCSDTHKE